MDLHVCQKRSDGLSLLGWTQQNPDINIDIGEWNVKCPRKDESHLWQFIAQFWMEVDTITLSGRIFPSLFEQTLEESFQLAKKGERKWMVKTFWSETLWEAGRVWENENDSVWQSTRIAWFASWVHESFGFKVLTPKMVSINIHRYCKPDSGVTRFWPCPPCSLPPSLLHGWGPQLTWRRLPLVNQKRLFKQI